MWAFDLVACEWKLRRVLETFQHVHEGDLVAITVDGETIEATGGHPFWVNEGEDFENRTSPEHLAVTRAASLPGRWLNAAELRVGDVLFLKDGRQLSITCLTKRHTRQPVYNLHVEELECYAVGKFEVLVHNTSGGPDAARRLIDWIVKELRMTRGQRELLHRQISRQGYTPEEIWEIARQILRDFPHR